MRKGKGGGTEEGEGEGGSSIKHRGPEVEGLRWRV